MPELSESIVLTKLSLISEMTMLKQKNKSASHTNSEGFCGSQKQKYNVASISFMPCTYFTPGFSFAYINRIRANTSAWVSMQLILSFPQRSAFLNSACLFNYSLRSRLVGSLASTKNDISVLVLRTSFSISIQISQSAKYLDHKLLVSLLSGWSPTAPQSFPKSVTSTSCSGLRFGLMISS